MSARNPIRSARHRYLWRTTALMLLFALLLVVFGQELLVAMQPLPPLARWGLVALTCLPLFLVAYEMVVFTRSSDELVSRMQVQAAAISALVVLLLGAVLGMADFFDLIEPFNTALLLPIAAIVNGAACFWQEYRMR